MGVRETAKRMGQNGLVQRVARRQFADGDQLFDGLAQRFGALLLGAGGWGAG